MSTENILFETNKSRQDADIWIIPATWDVTTSYRDGTVNGPSIIQDASSQLDTYHHEYKDMFEDGIILVNENETLKKENTTLRQRAKKIITANENNITLTEENIADLNLINSECNKMNQWIYKQTESAIKNEKLVGMIGGDHSTSLGIIQALADYIDTFGVLQFDAHMDLRDAYQGFTYSHASIMKHVTEISDISRLIQVGIRDYCEEELNVMKQSKGRIKTYFNHDLKKDLFQGKSWESICKKIINNCPDQLYISFDIDCLTPYLCPDTGTPVPGGLDFDQIEFLLNMIVKSGKRIIGFDLVEVNGEKNSINAIVGARVLAMLAGYYHKSNT